MTVPRGRWLLLAQPRGPETSQAVLQNTAIRTRQVFQPCLKPESSLPALMSHLYTAKEQFLQLTSEGFICNKLPVYKDAQPYIKNTLPSYILLCSPPCCLLLCVLSPLSEPGAAPSLLELFSFTLISHAGPEALLGPPLSYLSSQGVFFVIFSQDVQLTFLCSRDCCSCGLFLAPPIFPITLLPRATIIPRSL